MGVAADGGPHLNIYYAAVAGAITVREVGPERLRGTFALTLVDVYATNADTIRIENGVIDVPYIDELIPSASLRCLLSLAGVNVTCVE